jgi:type II secretory pathway component PulF
MWVSASVSVVRKLELVMLESGGEYSGSLWPGLMRVLSGVSAMFCWWWWALAVMVFCGSDRVIGRRRSFIC